MGTPISGAGPMDSQRNKILVVEDEAIIRADILVQLKSLGYEVVGTAADGRAAVDLAHEFRPHLVLMDVRLSDGVTGIDAACRIHEELHIPVVYLTANSDGPTIQSAKLAQPFGFIVKPFTQATLNAAIEIAIYKGDQERSSMIEHDQLFDLVSGRADRQAIFVKQREAFVRCEFSQIDYVEALRDYVAIHVRGRRFVVHSTMHHMEDVLPAKDFVRVHRSYIVRIDRIEAIEGLQIDLGPGRPQIPLGSTYLGSLLERFTRL
ncbi:MAG: response regulator [Flavobacteriales bacterium]|nr:response regulator [Flavobacteriales bacterium]